MPTLQTKIIYSCCFGYHVLHEGKKMCTEQSDFSSFFLRYFVGVKTVT